MGDPQKEERECRLGSHRRAKVALRGSRRYCKPPRNFLFQFAINKSTTPLVNRLRLATAFLESSVFIRGRKRTSKRESDRRTKKALVQLGRIKGIKGRLVTRIFRFPSTSTLIRTAKGETREGERERKKEKKKTLKSLLLSCSAILRSRSSRVVSFPPAATLGSSSRNERLH